jgi:hypothetical protein
MRIQADDPVRLLGPAVACYLDALTIAAERHVNQNTKDAIDTAGRRLGLTGADAWPTLRSHLLVVAANGHNPTPILDMAWKLGSLDTARDPAAVIDYRLDLTRANTHHPGPLPWLPGIPSQLLTHPSWGPYLQARFALTEELAAETLDAVTDQSPGWAAHLPDLDQSLVDDIRVWRAAHNTLDTDLRPTGPIRWTPAERTTQHDLDARLELAQADIREWGPRILQAVPTLAGDPGLPVLAAQLATLEKTGHLADRILNKAAGLGPLPDDHPADALSYRITRMAEHEARELARWESYDVSPVIADHLARPERYELPHSPTPSDRSPGIGF